MLLLVFIIKMQNVLHLDFPLKNERIISVCQFEESILQAYEIAFLIAAYGAHIHIQWRF